MIQQNKMTTAAAVSCLRNNSRYAGPIRDSHLDQDGLAAAQRFYESAEFSEVGQLLGGNVRDAGVLDLGAGTGVASYAFARAGAQVYSLELDDSEIGRKR